MSKDLYDQAADVGAAILHTVDGEELICCPGGEHALTSGWLVEEFCDFFNKYGVTHIAQILGNQGWKDINIPDGLYEVKDWLQRVAQVSFEGPDYGYKPTADELAEAMKNSHK